MVPIRSGVVCSRAVATICAAALSAPASASATPSARWVAATRTAAESGTTRASPWPVTETVRMAPILPDGDERLRPRA